jgi:hypothetical protein
MIMSQNWDDMGIAWVTGIVSRENGGHRTDRAPLGTAYYPTISNLEKAIAHFGSSTVLAWINASNSIRVMAQSINRAGIEHRVPADEIKTRIYNRLRGMRNVVTHATTTVRVRVVTLIDGTTYDGDDLTEYRQLQMAAMVDLGIDPTVARDRASAMVLPTI